jgi:hypothetical protein
MSEYQYYEFLAIDRPLSDEDRKALRAISTRAEISSTSFTNHYEWGDLKADPRDFMRHWFDIHVYLANWGNPRLMIRLPKQFADRGELEAVLGGSEYAEIFETEEHLILDLLESDAEGPDEFDDGSGWMAELKPLRADLLAGDYRLLYLMWLIDVQYESLEEDTPEPLPGIGPLTPQLKAAGKFFYLDDDLVSAAAERKYAPTAEQPSSAALRKLIEALPDEEKIEHLVRLYEGDPLAAASLQTRIRGTLKPAKRAPAEKPRTVSELLARAEKRRARR